MQVGGSVIMWGVRAPLPTPPSGRYRFKAGFEQDGEFGDRRTDPVQGEAPAEGRRFSRFARQGLGFRVLGFRV